RSRRGSARPRPPRGRARRVAPSARRRSAPAPAGAAARRTRRAHRRAAPPPARGRAGRGRTASRAQLLLQRLVGLLRLVAQRVDLVLVAPQVVRPVLVGLLEVADELLLAGDRKSVV